MGLAKTLALIGILILIGIALELLNHAIHTVLKHPYDLKGAPQVIDADTIYLDGWNVRLYGLDAPELHQICERDGQTLQAGREATHWLTARLKGRTIGCNIESWDKRYHRPVATCYLDGQDLNALIVFTGWAWAYRRYSERYIPDETTAKAAKKGIWISDCAPAWDYRHNK